MRRTWPRPATAPTGRAILATALVGLVLSSCSSSGTGAAKQAAGLWAGRTIALGAIYSTTGAGAAYGPQSLKAAELAVNQVNASGGVLGAKLTLTEMNDDSDPALAAADTRTLIGSDHVVAILGPTLSNAAAQSHAIADAESTVVLATSNTGPGIVGDCAYPCRWVFRDSLGEQAAIPANLAEYAGDAHPHTAAVIYATPGDSLGEDEAAIAEQALPLDGIHLSTAVSYPAGTAKLAPYVKRAIAGSPDVLIDLGSSAPSLASVMELARSDGFLGKFLGGNTFNSTQVAQLSAAAGLGAQSASAWFLGNSFPANLDFVQAYESAYRANPDEFAAQAYTGVELLADALSRANLTFKSIAGDRVALYNALTSTSIETPLGPFSFTATHDVQQPIWIVQMNGQGGYTLVTSELVNAP